MMGTKVLSLVPRKQNGKTVEEMLQIALEEYRGLPSHHGFNKGIVLLLDDSADGYEPYYYSVGLNRPETIALLEVIKAKFKMTLCQEEAW